MGMAYSPSWYEKISILNLFFQMIFLRCFCGPASLFWTLIFEYVDLSFSSHLVSNWSAHLIASSWLDISAMATEDRLRAPVPFMLPSEVFLSLDWLKSITFISNTLPVLSQSLPSYIANFVCCVAQLLKLPEQP